MAMALKTAGMSFKGVNCGLVDVAFVNCVRDNVFNKSSL